MAHKKKPLQSMMKKHIKEEAKDVSKDKQLLTQDKAMAKKMKKGC